MYQSTSDANIGQPATLTKRRYTRFFDVENTYNGLVYSKIYPCYVKGDRSNILRLFTL